MILPLRNLIRQQYPVYFMARCMKKRGWWREESERLRVCALERAFFPPPGPAFYGNKGAMS
jgi:hypothetical protein